MKPSRLLPRLLRIQESRWLFASWAAVGLVTAVYAGWLEVKNPTIVALSFLLVVLIVAAVSTLRIAVSTSLLAFLCFNFFFLSPVGTFTIDHPEDWAALFTLLAVSIVASQLSAQARRRAREATARRDELARLLDLTRDILLMTDTTVAVESVARCVERRFGFQRVSIYLRAENGWESHGGGAPVLDLDAARLDRLLASARESPAPQDGERSPAPDSGAGAADRPPVWLVPLRFGDRAVGLLALEGGNLERETRDAIAGVTAIAIERTHLLEERKEAEVVRRSSELKSALLASLSHDLKTPLTAVTVAANNLTASWLTVEERGEQTQIVLAELERLGRLIHNLVDLARIEIDAVAAEREWVEAAEIVEAAARQVEHTLARHSLELDGAAEHTLVRLDPRLTSAALAHVLENAAQYSPPGSTITVRVAIAGDELQITVRDRGVGIAGEDAPRLFDRFYRGAAARGYAQGTGMGLAITRGLLAAQGGRVAAESCPDGGAIFTIALRVETRDAPDLEERAL